MLKRLKSELSTPIYVMIRPHSDSFFYNGSDFDTMKATIISFDKLGADGFVFGILKNDVSPGSPSTPWIDVTRNSELVHLAGGKPCTFHRAFDYIPESMWEPALRDIIACGFTSILTSGGPSGNQATDCIGLLTGLIDHQIPDLQSCIKGNGRVPEIIIGGGVRSTNIELLVRETRGRWLHSSALVSSSEVVDVDEVARLKRLMMECHYDA